MHYAIYYRHPLLVFQCIDLTNLEVVWASRSSGTQKCDQGVGIVAIYESLRYGKVPSYPTI